MWIAIILSFVIQMKIVPIKILFVFWTAASGRIFKDNMRNCVLITGQFISVACERWMEK